MMNAKTAVIATVIVLLVAGASYTVYSMNKKLSSDSQNGEEELDGYFADISSAKSLALCNYRYDQETNNSASTGFIKNISFKDDITSDKSSDDKKYVKKLYKINQSDEYELIKVSEKKNFSQSSKKIDFAIEDAQIFSDLFWIKTVKGTNLLLDMTSGKIFSLSNINNITINEDWGFKSSVIYHQKTMMYALLKCSNAEHNDTECCLFKITIDHETMKIEECNHNLCSYTVKCRDGGICNITENGIIGFSYDADRATDIPEYLYYPDGTAAKNLNMYSYFDGHYCRNIAMNGNEMTVFPISCTRLSSDGTEYNYNYSDEDAYLYASNNLTLLVKKWASNGCITTGSWEDKTLCHCQFPSKSNIIFLNTEKGLHHTSITFTCSGEMYANNVVDNSPGNGYSLTSVIKNPMIKITVYDNLTYSGERLGEKEEYEYNTTTYYNYKGADAYSSNHFYYFNDDKLIQYDYLTNEKTEFSSPTILKYNSVYLENGLTYVKATSTQLNDVIITIDHKGKIHMETYEPELIALEVYPL